jgi:3-oxoacyl-[acyl-carrier protein] reductase
MEIKDSVSIVSGASRGIGRATAELLAREGGKVVVNARTETDALRQIVKNLGTGKGLVAAGDVGDMNACRKIVEAATARFGRVDILVNNAGIFGLVKMEKMQPEDWETMFRVHVFGAFNLIHLVLPGMLERKRGVIVNVSSIAAARPPGPGRVHYGAAKAALVGMTRALGQEIASQGVRVVGIAPGLTDTEMVRKGIPNLAKRAEQIPMGRIGTPEDIAHAVRFAIENEFLTAETLFVTGGE